MTVGLAHFDDAPERTYDEGHIRGRWTALGEAAGSIAVGVRRIRVPSGGWSTPAHDHGRAEEIFYVLGGEGLVWHRGATAPIGPDDCIVFHPRRGGHSLHAMSDLDVLAFGPRTSDEAPAFERLGASFAGMRFVESAPGLERGVPVQFVREAALGPPELPPQPGPRPSTIVNRADVEPETAMRPRVARARRDLGRAAGSRTTGLKHITVEPGRLSAPLHCHSLEEELFVILGGTGTLILGEDEVVVRQGHVISRPAGTGVAHAFRGGDDGLTLLAYGMRETADLCYYPTSGKVSIRGLGIIGRIEPLDYWDGED
jgi:uncharacterized cupin superfamily protein